MAAKKVWQGRVCVERTRIGIRSDGTPKYRERYEFVGRFDKKADRDAAVAARKAELASQTEQEAKPLAERITCAEYADEYVARMESGDVRTKKGRRYKDSSVDTTRSQLAHFKREYGDRPLAWLSTDEACYAAVRWAAKTPAGCVQTTTSLANRAVAERLLTYNPFKGLGRRVEGRTNEDPPTEAEFDRLLDACDALGGYAPRMRAVLRFAADTITRPGELFALDWERDIDLTADEVHINLRLYRGRLDLPKSNEERTIALLPRARAALLTLPERTGYVFRNKTGGQLTQPTLTAYWKEVKARAGLDFDFYLATKHAGVHYMKVKLGLPNHDIAAQAGWSESAVEKMIATYAHTSVGALERIKAAASADNVVPLRAAG